MGLEVLCMSILPTELSLFNYDKVNSVLQLMTPLMNWVDSMLESSSVLIFFVSP